MENLEAAFDTAESKTNAALEAHKNLGARLRALLKASKQGSITAVKREQGKLSETMAELAETIEDASVAWPFEDGEETQYLSADDGFKAELRRVAAERDLVIRERDGQLICHPFVVRVLPGGKAVRIDKKQVSTIRPSHLVGVLVKAQEAPARFKPQPFLEALYNVYRSLTKETSSRSMEGGGPVILLDEIYRLFTSLPGSRREYSKTDFARDLYELDRSGVKTTRSGATLSLPASTGARSARNLYTFVGPDGYEVKYYGIRFSEG